MESDKISVIIPVYQVEKYIERCILSVINQSYKNLQIILVDDGSKDNSGKICDAYALKDSRIHVVHKQNGGLSDARNVGTALAIGQFLFYLDSDDYLEIKAIENLYAIQKENNADVVIGNYWYSYTSHEDLAESIYSGNVIFSNTDAMEALMTSKLQTFAWGKLIKTELAKRYEFPKGKLFEDHFWTHLVFGDSKIIIYTDIPIIHYRQRDDSISYTYNIKSIDVIEGWIKRNDYLVKFYPQIQNAFLENCVEKYLGIAWLVLRKMGSGKEIAFKKMREYNRILRLQDYSDGDNRKLICALEKNSVLYGFLAYGVRVRKKIIKH